MPNAKLKSFLQENNVIYDVIKHSPTFTAQYTAHSVHISGKLIAKTVIVKVDGKISMAVLPGNMRVDIDKLREITGAEAVQIADEKEFEDLFPNCELGAMPPFGNLWNIPVYVAEKLRDDEEILFNAGTHTELIKMKYSDFEKLVKPKIAEIAFL